MRRLCAVLLMSLLCFGSQSVYGQDEKRVDRKAAEERESGGNLSRYH